ncbi:hypothetical protein CHL67_07865 [Prosthecochloris sp. GSB1]|nr:hypothetical protein CHL67_07865 [Prosthecochloris sp. GSB1]
MKTDRTRHVSPTKKIRCIAIGRQPTKTCRAEYIIWQKRLPVDEAAFVGLLTARLFFSRRNRPPQDKPAS